MREINALKTVVNVMRSRRATESEILKKVNAPDIGPRGFGGRTTALNVDCHVTRHCDIVI